MATKAETESARQQREKSGTQPARRPRKAAVTSGRAAASKKLALARKVEPGMSIDADAPKRNSALRNLNRGGKARVALESVEVSEDGAVKRPSRKSSRRSANRQKPANQLRAKALNRASAPSAVHARSR